MQTLWQDLRYALRVLIKSTGFTSIAILTLALGIGANTAIFTIVYGVLLRPLPFPHPERIVQLVERYKAQFEESGLDMRQFLQLQKYNELFENIAGYTGVGYNLTAPSGAERLRGMPISANYFQVLGIHPVVGRDFLPEEDLGEGRRVAILSHGLWMRRFGGDVHKIGQSVVLNGEPFTIVGVMPRTFDPFGTNPIDPGLPDVWTPLALVAKTAGSGGNISVLARLKPEVTRAQLEAQMNVVTQDLRQGYARGMSGEVILGFIPYQRMVGAEVRPYLLVLLGAIGFVLLIACANVANLLLARGGLRTREIAVRIAIGASRWRLFQQLITESMLLGLVGGAVGLGLAYLGLGSLLALAPVTLPRSSDVHLDSSAFTFTFAVSLLTGMIFGLIPALQSSHADINEGLKEGAGRSSASAGRSRLRQGLVIVEFAISLVLLTGAGLMIGTFSKLLKTDPGFKPHGVLSVQFWLIGSKYNSMPQIDAFNRALIDRLDSLPGVESAAIIAAGMPLERGGNDGVKVPPEADYDSVDYREITPGYFTTLGIPLRQGRLFSDSDTADSAKVVMVNESLVRAHFGGRNPVHAQIFLGNTPAEVVGIVGDVKSHLDQPAAPTTFVPEAQASFGRSKLFEAWFPRVILIRASGEPLAVSHSVTEALAALDSTVPVGKVRSMDQVLVRSVALRSFLMTLLSLFASLALMLACVGIYGVISYAVSQRTREIGVRMALGARPSDVLRLILSEGMRLIFFGAVLGIAAALGLTRLLADILYGVKATDPAIFLSVTGVLIVVSLAACYMPARRAMRVDPIVALRYE